MEQLMVKIHDKDVVENFLATELDIYGMKTNLNTDELTDLILNQIEEIV
jgi:hypothetical protein